MRTAIGIARHRRSRLHVAITLVAAALSLAAVLLPMAGTSDAAAAAERPLQATSHTVWLCQPGHKPDPCAESRTATSVTANGATSAFSTAQTAQAKKFDCFYVYPTVSQEPSLNADLAIQTAETEIAEGQVSQFSTVCNVWAPMYRQATEAALGDGEIYTSQVIATAYDSLLAAWKDFLAHDDDGRPVIFIGHSQGAGMLIKLLRSQVDPSPKLRKRLVSAIILGGNVQVPTGRHVGGSFRHIPTCAAASQTGCVIAYSTFPAEPSSDAILGRPGQGVSVLSGQTARRGQQVACVNPVNFSSAVANLVPMYPTVVHPFGPVTTPWITFPNLYSAQCMHNGDASWLQVDRLVAPPGDDRPGVTDEGPMWGYHLDDMNLALGNLILDVAYEEASYG
jgi:hypothetical protein